MVQRVIKSL